jgi:flagellar export protein FliJ
MSAIDSLVRLHRWQLDEYRRQLADLDLLAQKLRAEKLRLTEEETTEQQVASTSLEAATAYGGFARQLIERRDKIEQSIISVEQQIAAAREALAETYQEVKRYEIALANRATQRRKRSERQQQRTLDDLGIDGYRRRTTG